MHTTDYGSIEWRDKSVWSLYTQCVHELRIYGVSQMSSHTLFRLFFVRFGCCQRKLRKRNQDVDRTRAHTHTHTHAHQICMYIYWRSWIVSISFKVVHKQIDIDKRMMEWKGIFRPTLTLTNDGGIRLECYLCVAYPWKFISVYPLQCNWTQRSTAHFLMVAWPTKVAFAYVVNETPPTKHYRSTWADRKPRRQKNQMAFTVSDCGSYVLHLQRTEQRDGKERKERRARKSDGREEDRGGKR